MSDSKVHWLRGAVIFIPAYVVVTIVATVFSISVAMLMHVTGIASPMDNPAYQVSERFLPLINLVVWMAFAAIYFARRGLSASTVHALKLGVLWLVMAITVDFLLFVQTKTPISLSPHDFYVRQFPWIYLIYIAVVFSPFCYTLLRGAFTGRPKG